MMDDIEHHIGAYDKQELGSSTLVWYNRPFEE